MEGVEISENPIKGEPDDTIPRNVALNERGHDASNPITEDDLPDLLKLDDKFPTGNLKDPAKERRLVVVKNGIGGSKIGIVRYGPPNRSIYNREDVTGLDITGVQDISEGMNRLGEQYSRDSMGRKIWTYNRRDLVSIQGVALPPNVTLKELKKKRPGDKVYMPVDVLIKWNHNKAGTFQHSWETRTSFKRIWGRSGAGPDAAIAQAAEYADTRFQEWKSEQPLAEARDGSPTPDPDFRKSRSKRDKKATSKRRNKATSKKGRKSSENSESDSESDEESESSGSESDSSEGSSDSEEDSDEAESDDDEKKTRSKSTKKEKKTKAKKKMDKAKKDIYKDKELATFIKKKFKDEAFQATAMMLTFYKKNGFKLDTKFKKLSKTEKKDAKKFLDEIFG